MAWTFANAYTTLDLVKEVNEQIGRVETAGEGNTPERVVSALNLAQLDIVGRSNSVHSNLLYTLQEWWQIVNLPNFPDSIELPSECEHIRYITNTLQEQADGKLFQVRLAIAQTIDQVDHFHYSGSSREATVYQWGSKLFTYATGSINKLHVFGIREPKKLTLDDPSDLLWTTDVCEIPIELTRLLILYAASHCITSQERIEILQETRKEIADEIAASKAALEEASSYRQSAKVISLGTNDSALRQK